ncbi:MAG: PIN domain-containing protein [Candidatus Brocadiaceae bacterium]|nr:PIN domain-containing protein [Candidatus Brocadiaceae bacterium]
MGRQARNKGGEEAMINNLFEILTPIAVDEAIADKTGEYLRKHSKGYDLNIGDAIIAATTKEMALKLVTRNVKHYPMKDIEVIRLY